MPEIIAVDFGGTNIRAAYFPSPEPPPATQIKIPTKADEGPEAVLGRLVEAIESQYPDRHHDLRIGIASPGPLNPMEGIILMAPNLNGWRDVPLRDRVQDRFGVPVFIGNDANLAALGEWRFGAGRGTRHMIYLTLSTGIGGGVIVDGRLLLGWRGLAAELGHLTLDTQGPLCGCGQKGHAEALAAGPAIARRAIERLHSGEPSSLASELKRHGTLTAKQVGDAARHGDNLAIQTIAEAGAWIGLLLADLAHAFNPQIFVLGGGVSQIGALLFDPIERSLERHVMDPAYIEGLRILPAELGDDAGLVGAMVLASLKELSA